MNELKYRIKEWIFPVGESCYTAQYKILGLWMYIDINQTGCFMRGGTVHCNTYEEAMARVKLHRENMRRADYPIETTSVTVWES